MLKVLWTALVVGLVIAIHVAMMWLRGAPIVDESRLIMPEDRDYWESRFQDQIPETFVLETDGEPVLGYRPTQSVNASNALLPEA